MNRRSFFSTLFALPVAAVAAIHAKPSGPVDKLRCVTSGHWKYYTDKYTHVGKYELLAKMRKAVRTFNPKLLEDLKGNRYRTFTVDPHGKITASEKA